MAQLECSAPKKITYFGVKAAAFPATCCLEIGGLDYEGVSVDFPTWATMKENTPTGVLPIMEMQDGTIIPESGAIGRVCAAAAGLLGEGNDYIKSEMLFGLTVDLMKKVFEFCPTMMTVKDFDEAKTKALEADGKPQILEFLKKYDAFLLEAGDRFTKAGNSFGEIDFFCKLYMISNGAIPEAVSGKVSAFYKRMLEIPGIKKVIDGDSKFGKLADYLVPAPASGGNVVAGTPVGGDEIKAQEKPEAAEKKPKGCCSVQ